MNGLPIEFKLKLKNNHVGYEKSVLNGIMETWHSIDGETYHCILDHPSWYIRHDEKCQYTGYNDRNGEKIYFDDKLKVPEDNKVFTVAVKYGRIFAIHPDTSPGFGANGFKDMELIK